LLRPGGGAWAGPERVDEVLCRWALGVRELVAALPALFSITAARGRFATRPPPRSLAVTRPLAALAARHGRLLVMETPLGVVIPPEQGPGVTPAGRCALL
jgi:hypothetical protein